MKKQIYNLIIILLFLFSVGFYYNLNAQCPGCVTDMNFIITPAAPGINPDTLPDGIAGQYYDADVNFYLPAQFTTQGTNVTLTKLEVLSVAGLPFGISFQSSSANNTFFPSQNPPTTEHGCAKICGTPAFAGQYSMVVFVRAYVNTIIGSQTSDNSFTIPVKILPGSAGNTSFSLMNGSGCGIVTATVSTNLPSNGKPGFSYLWNFGNGTTSTSETPAAVTYSTPGQYSVTCQTIIDTVKFSYLNNITVLGTSCSDITSNPDLYVTVKDLNDNTIYKSAAVNNTNPPVSFTLPNVQINHNQSYVIQVSDEDTGLEAPDDLCNSFQIPGNSLGNTLWSGSDGISFTASKLLFTYIDTAIVTVYALPQRPVITAFPSNGVCINDSILLSCSNADNYQWFNDTSLLLGATQQSMYVFTSGKYYVIVSDSIGCQAQSDTSIISFYSIPPKPTFWRTGDTLKTLSNAFSLQWYFNGNPITGETDQTCLITAAGNYKVIATSQHGCSKSSDVVYYQPLSHSSIEDTENLINDFTLYPNPNDGNFNVKFSVYESSNIDISIYNMLGQQLYIEKVNNFIGTYNKEPEIRLSPSVYFLELKTDRQVLRRERIVVE